METDDIFKIMLSNSVTLHRGKPYCYKCSIHIENWNDSLSHIQSEEHLSLIKDYKCLCSPKLVNFSAKQSRTWVESGIVIDTINKVKCMLCSCTLSPIDDLCHIEQHIRGKFHRTALNVSILRDMSLCTVEKSLFDYKQILMENKLKVTTSSYLICIACLCTLAPIDVLPHIKAKRHKSKIQSVEFDPRLLTAKSTKHDTNHNFIGDNATHKVNTLQENDTIDDYSNHGIVHGETEHFSCSICLCSGMLLENALQHIRESHHVTALKNSVSIERNEVSATTESRHNRKPSGLTIETAGPKDVVRNVARTQWFENEGIIVSNYNTVICTVCFRPLPSLSHDIQHLKGRRHSNALKAIQKTDILPLLPTKTDLKQDTGNDTLTEKSEHESFDKDKLESDTFIHGTGQQIMQHDISSHHDHSYTMNENMSTRNRLDSLTNRNGRNWNKNADTELTVPQCYICNQSSQETSVHSLNETQLMLGYIVGIRCLCCNIVLHSQGNVRDHFSNNKHQENVKQLLKSITKTHFGSSKYSALTNVNTFTEYETFPLCNLVFLKSREQNLCDKEITFVTVKVRWKNISDTSITNGITGLLFTCNVCYIKLSNPLHLIEHLSSKKQAESVQVKSHSKTPSHPKTEGDMSLPDLMSRLSVKSEKQKEERSRELESKRRIKPRERNRENGRQKEERTKEFVISPDICANIRLQIQAVPAIKHISAYTNADDLLPEATYNHDFIKIDAKMYNFEILKDGCIIRIGPNYYCVICDRHVSNQKEDLVLHIFYCNKKKALASRLKRLSKKLTEEAESSRTGVILELESYMDKWYWYSINRFCCLLCRVSFTNKSKFISHILQWHFGLNKLNLIFEGCMSCGTLWATSTAFLIEHQSHPTHLYLKTSKLFYVEALPAAAGQLLKEIEVAMDELYQLSENVLISNISALVCYTQYKLKASLESFLKTMLGLLTSRIKVFFYGPRSTGLTFNESNLYIVYEKIEGNVIEDLNEDCAMEWYAMPVADKKQSEVKQIRHKEISMVCDVRSNGDADIRKSEILRLFCKRYLPCRRLILFLKKWVSNCYLPGRYKISEEAFTWLVVFSLQANSHLPSVESHLAQEYNYQAPNENSVTAKTIRQLLVEFFTFYMDFDYRRYVISPFMGRKIRKEDFIEIDTLPKEMHEYFKKHANTRYFNVGNSLCLQDPVDLNCNLTKTVQTITLNHFRVYCKKSVTVLLDTET